MGQRMLNLLPLPNGVLNQQAGQEWTSNDAQDAQPIHKRMNFVTRIDAVLSQSTALQRAGRCSTGTTARRTTASRRASAR